ncbi:hypothetical protein ElyMa_004127300 [Elysia marginata]|uniref:G-protein coupled receptors family 1 profile domain-containing protein n=1 Tax=Elysia marginata TaxID=1093978 RepID=A0AAV4GDU0_9GAST|nr:hypothetical protein ElyMa_004127300 [Elysia marginata]
MNLKATSTTLSLAVPFVICATPKVLTYMFLAFNPRERIKVESLTLLAVTIYLNVSNSLINPIVYCYRLPELRTQIVAAFGRRMTSSGWSSDEPMKPQRSSSFSSKPSESKDSNETDLKNKMKRNDTRSIFDQSEDELNGSKCLNLGDKTSVTERDVTPPKDARNLSFKDDNPCPSNDMNREVIEGPDLTTHDCIETCTHQETSSTTTSGNRAGCLKNVEVPDCSRGDDTCADAASFLQRKGGKKGERVRIVSEQTNTGEYKWLVDPATLDRKTNRRRRSDCSGIPTKFHISERDGYADFESKSNIEECQKKFQSTPNFEEHRETLKPSPALARFGGESELRTKPEDKAKKENFMVDDEGEASSDKQADNKQDKLEYPGTNGRSSPEGSMNTEVKDADSIETSKAQDTRQEVGKGSQSGDKTKTFSFKHIWRLWAEAVLTEAAKNLVYGTLGQYSLSGCTDHGDKNYPLRNANGKSAPVTENTQRAKLGKPDAGVECKKGRNCGLETSEKMGDYAVVKEPNGMSQTKNMAYAFQGQV